MRLSELVRIIRFVLPDAKETVKWSVPSFSQNGKALQFSAGKSRVSLYVGEEAIERLMTRAEGFDYKNGAVYLPYDKPLPNELIENAVIEALRIDNTDQRTFLEDFEPKKKAQAGGN